MTSTEPAHHADIHVTLDWDALVYTSNVPQSLYCPVCKNVLLTPLQTSCEYKHTLCARCLTRALDERLECPVDRIPMPGGLETCKPAPNIVQQVLDDLEVHCPNEGCTRCLPRAMVVMHMKEDCSFQSIACPDEECVRFNLRWESVEGQCSHGSTTCDHCQDTVMEKNMTAHLDECAELSHECKHCHLDLSAEEMRRHREECLLQPANCTASKLGCPWHGDLSTLDSHRAECSIEMLRPWLERQEARISELELENRSLKSRVEHSRPLDSADAVIEVSSEYERDRSYLFQTLETLSGSLEALSTSMAAMDTRNNHIIMSESVRTKDEIGMLRLGLQSLRMQWHHFVQNTRGPIISTGPAYERGRENSAAAARTSPTRTQPQDSSRVKL